MCFKFLACGFKHLLSRFSHSKRDISCMSFPAFSDLMYSKPPSYFCVCCFPLESNVMLVLLSRTYLTLTVSASEPVVHLKHNCRESLLTFLCTWRRRVVEKVPFFNLNPTVGMDTQACKMVYISAIETENDGS